MSEEEELLRRLARLERSEKLLRLTLYMVVLLIGALAALASLLLRRPQEPPVAEPPLRGKMIPQSGALTATGLVLRDAAGNNRIWMAVDPKDDTAKIRLMDAQGNVRMTLRAGADRGSLALFDGKGRVRAVSSSDAMGAAGFMVLDEAERPRAALGTLAGPDPGITVLDAAGKPLVQLPAKGK